MSHLGAGHINRVYYWPKHFVILRWRITTSPSGTIPFDIGTAYAFVKNRWTECHSEHYTVLQGRSERELMLASKELRRRRLLHSRERFTLTARKLADFLDSAEAEEKCLLQRLRDRESASLRQNSLVSVPCAHGAEAESTESESSNTTRELSDPNQAEATAVYGDF